jgi:hypothetical protein
VFQRLSFRLIKTIAAASFGLLLMACQAVTPPTQAARVLELTVTPSLAPTASATQTTVPTFTPEPSLSPTPSLTPEPFGCQTPPDDYTQIVVDGWLFNRRTYAMLEQAARIYGGELEITGYAITQGSYQNNVAASFGTHSGGGAVDLSVMRTGTYQVVWEDIEPLVRALRAAGFAAWLRDLDELYPGSPIHIHAVAIGDIELSQAAVDQLTGPRGYFRGFTGIPYGEAAFDRHGGPIVCQWMLDLGYGDWRTPTP